MILFRIYDKLQPTDFIQCVDNEEIIKRELKTNYYNLLKKKDFTQLERMKDFKIQFIGRFENGNLSTELDNEEKSLLEYLGVKENENL